MKFITQAAKVLNEQKKYKRRLAVFLCLAVVVALGTAAALKMYGQAMSHKQKKLVCRYAAHAHTDGCFDGEAVVCGYADYAVHLHNDDCYGPNGELVCHLPEAEAHVHTEECYTEQEVLICEEEGAQAHEHTEGCYTPERGELSCQMEEHMHEDSCYGENGEIICPLEEHQHDDNCYEWKDVLTCTLGGHEHTQDCYTREMRELSCNLEEHGHGEACYEENGELACQLEEHTHEDNCYAWEDVLTCQLEESDGGHVHGDGCYEMQKVLSCGKLELHTHDDSCCDENGALVCGLLQLEEHVHGKDCFETVELTEEEILALTGDEEETVSEDTVSKDSVSGDAVSEGSVSGDSVSADNAEDAHEHTEECYDAAGGLICGYNKNGEKEASITKSYTDEKYIVTAFYNKDANIPDEAEFLVEEITAESEAEHYAEREAEFRKSLGDEKATMKALLKVGFFVDGQEIEPESPVTLSVRFLDEEGLPEGAPITVVHFAKQGTKTLKGSEAENDSTAFEMEGFSEIGVGIDEIKSGQESIEDGVRSVTINETYEYDTEQFHMEFEFKGKADVLDNKADKNGVISDNIVNESVEKNENNAASTSVNEENTSIKENIEDSYTEELESSTDGISNEEGYIDIEESDEASSIEDVSTDSNIGNDFTDEETQDLRFTADTLDTASSEYKTGIRYAQETTQGEVFALQAIRYNLTYKGQELDTSDCSVTVKVIPTREFNDYMEEVVSEKAEETTLENDIVSVTVVELSEYKDKKEITSTLHGKQQMVKFNATSDTFVAYGSRLSDPEYTVQYYANLDRLKLDGPVNQNTTGKPINKDNHTAIKNEYQNSIREDLLPFIDTSKDHDGTGGNLPQNGIVPNTVTVSIKNNKVTTTSEVTEVYRSRKYHYIKAPTLKYVNVLADNKGYSLKEIWVQPDGNNPTSTERGDWEIYGAKDGKFDYIHFTNRKETIDKQPPGETFILISSKTVIRMVYNTTSSERNSPAVFYDYDISNGTHTTNSENVQVINTQAEGINSSQNCKETVKYAFGNNNAGTNFGANKIKGSLLNMTNLYTGDGSFGYAGCTFGIAASSNKESLDFNVPAPEVFGNTPQVGKYRVVGGQDENYSLDFGRKGDTYTLKAVKGTTATNLDAFNHPVCDNTTHQHILTNNFWPMDSIDHWGKSGHDIKFGSKEKKDQRRFYPGTNPTNHSLPVSDDGQDHNSYFGMYYTVDFDLDSNYVGPLEYLFYGDDDMWVFLNKGNTSKLICDIGGVHSSVGEYVDLWDWISSTELCKHEEDSCYDKNGELICKENVYTLSFFYTERGASGSSCWMQFTLPSITTMTPETTGEDYGKLKIRKAVTVNNPGIGFDSDQDTFKFNITLKDAKDDYSYKKYNSEGKLIEQNLIIWDGGSFTLKNGQYIIIDNLPVGTEYTITEENSAKKVFETDSEGTITREEPSQYDYFTDVSINNTPAGNGDLTDNKIASGIIESIASGQMAEVLYTNKFYVYELPETGGPGITIIYMAVLLLAGTAALLKYKQLRYRREGVNR